MVGRTEPMSSWLIDHITTTTGVAPGAGNLRPARCRSCGSRTLEGLNDDVAAYTVSVDPTPLGPVGEALAQLTGRATYTIRGFGRRYRLQRRDRWQIVGLPAGTPRRTPADVVADHRCGQPLPGIDTALTPPVRTGADDGPAPY